MNETVILRAGRAGSEPSSSPELLLRPWCMEDAAALVEVYRDPALRRWTGSVVDDEADAARWVQAQERDRAAGVRFGFAVLEAQPGTDRGRLAGGVVLKGAAPGNPSAEVGYWTAVHARGRGVAPRALEAPPDFPLDGHVHTRHRDV
ncbi:GNAT family N-acetyltransferase [Streptomyces sp. NPDC001404]|uniref:GNAT family N-acetyltransferase n=1 Tax=Streptomyces sp. NPDC001404 TaxID=3364571 RepID=UPI003692F129